MKNFIGLIIVSCGLLLNPFISVQIPVAIAQQTCPKITGSWQRQDGFVWRISQSNCQLIGRLDAPAFTHKINGILNNNGFANVVTTRTNLRDGCTTEMYNTLQVIDYNRFITKTYGTDGRCDLSVNFTDEWVYTRLR